MSGSQNTNGRARTSPPICRSAESEARSPLETFVRAIPAPTIHKVGRDDRTHCDPDRRRGHALYPGRELVDHLTVLPLGKLRFFLWPPRVRGLLTVATVRAHSFECWGSPLGGIVVISSWGLGGDDHGRKQ